MLHVNAKDFNSKEKEFKIMFDKNNNLKSKTNH